MTKIWFISDTHNHHEQLTVPTEVDAVIHCGDESTQRKTHWNECEARNFFEWFAGLSIGKKFFVPGNHSMAIAKGRVRPEEYPTIQFLVHAGCQWNDLRLFGSPYTPWFFGWAYNIARSDLGSLWSQIPAGVDILITHGPPKGILDVTRDWRTKEPIHIGSKSLTRQVSERICPRIHAFGHLHDEEGIQNFGTVTQGKTQYVNCACCYHDGQLVHHGIVLEV